MTKAQNFSFLSNASVRYNTNLWTACLIFFQVFDNYAVTVMIGGEPYTLGLFDTAGQ